ncbi:flagellar export protein FliJ [Paenisporosarcina cavernae]|uniref:Flagellar FliJ protein n=1 Tax=Paenisporosarcina cavernae TaxID=2320858 RepID=A0A385YUK3_9BACL|nr:flagellar export protein FliJ [Paenisporosarcina cavernae]AYC29242.1 flagellar export protein FliJ [Paenisporosarcina cavernae]
MTAYNYRFENVLTLRDQEKTEMEVAYKDSVRHFEDVATKLYDLLKKKENTLENQQMNLEKGSTMDDFHHYTRFINGLERSINDLQQIVVQARIKMNWHEEKLIEKNMEVRKYEKMREKDYSQFIELQNKNEMNRLDELSTLAFRQKRM